MDFITIKEAAVKWSVSERRILQYCHAGRIYNAKKMGNTWIFPKDTEKPKDRRTKEAKSD